MESHIHIYIIFTDHYTQNMNYNISKMLAEKF